jgi:hypothetical protein
MADIASGAVPRRTSGSPNEAWNADSGFYLTMVLISTAIIFAGFAPSFYLKSVIHAPPPLSLLTVSHGVVFTAWMALVIAQATLIKTAQPALHRQLGILGALLFGAMVTLGIWTAVTAGRLGHVPPGAPAPLAFMALPLMAITAATALVAGALWNRQRSAWHKRLMVASFFVMTGPGTGRIVIPLGFAPLGSQLAIIVAELLLVVAMVHDYRRHGQVHRAYWMTAVVFAVFHAGVTWAFTSPPLWMDFAQAITQG